MDIVEKVGDDIEYLQPYLTLLFFEFLTTNNFHSK
jgi:hypothetical protein